MTRILRLLMLSLGAVLVLFPFLFMLSTSFKPQAEVFSAGVSLIPSHFAGWENYSKAFTRIPMGRILLNGVEVCVAIVGFQIIFALPAAYALAKLRFRGRDLLFGLVPVSYTHLTLPTKRIV